LLLASTAFTGCYYDNEEDLYPPPAVVVCDTSDVSYTAEILPLLQANCTGCHSGSAPSGNVNLEGHANVVAAANSGRLYGTIAHLSGFSPMPKGGSKLPNCQIVKLRAWINAGSPNN
jgi:mono/diheme cytochrome c family protein